jgi:hypothetical protein
VFNFGQEVEAAGASFGGDFVVWYTSFRRGFELFCRFEENTSYGKEVAQALQLWKQDLFG